MMLSITVPTYNERENLRPLVERIAGVLEGREWEIVVVDDNSPDGTAVEAMEMAKEYPIKVVVREKKQGLASAILNGFRNSGGEIVGVIDADLQHPPELVEELVGAIEQGNDIAIGSRYVSGGRIQEWSLIRKVVSRGAILLARPLTRVKDSMSGYFFVRREVIERYEFAPKGYKLLLEVLAYAECDQIKIKEVPYTFMKREIGQSELNGSEIISYLALLSRLYLYKAKHYLNLGKRKIYSFIRRS